VGEDLAGLGKASILAVFSDLYDYQEKHAVYQNEGSLFEFSH
jgi:hypothetical protein